METPLIRPYVQQQFFQHVARSMPKQAASFTDYVLPKLSSIGKPPSLVTTCKALTLLPAMDSRVSIWTLPWAVNGYTLSMARRRRATLSVICSQIGWTCWSRLSTSSPPEAAERLICIFVRKVGWVVQPIYTRIPTRRGLGQSLLVPHSGYRSSGGDASRPADTIASHSIHDHLERGDWVSLAPCDTRIRPQTQIRTAGC